MKLATKHMMLHNLKGGPKNIIDYWINIGFQTLIHNLWDYKQLKSIQTCENIQRQDSHNVSQDLCNLHPNYGINLNISKKTFKK